MNIENRVLTEEEYETLGIDPVPLISIAVDTDANKIAAIFTIDLTKRGRYCGDFEGALRPACTQKCGVGFVASAAEGYRGMSILPNLAMWTKKLYDLDILYVGPQEKLPPRVLSIFWQVGVEIPPDADISDEHSSYENMLKTNKMIHDISIGLGYDV